MTDASKPFKLQLEPGKDGHKEFIKELTALGEYFALNNISTLKAINLMMNLIVGAFVREMSREDLEDFLQTGLNIYDLNMEKK